MEIKSNRFNYSLSPSVPLPLCLSFSLSLSLSPAVSRHIRLDSLALHIELFAQGFAWLVSLIQLALADVRTPRQLCPFFLDISPQTLISLKRSHAPAKM
jgi:hypothetical protein